MRPAEPGETTMSFHQVLGVVRRRSALIVTMVIFGSLIGLYLAWKTPVSYYASAMLRMAGERQTLTGDQNDAPALDRSADPLLSLIQLIRSPTVAGAVVDSLGLQLVSTTEDFPVSRLESVRVDPRAAGDSVVLTFNDSTVEARRAERAVIAPYGRPVNLGVTQFVVRSRPPVDAAVLQIVPHESAVENVLAGIQASRREATDVIDVGYTAAEPQTAQAIVNTTVKSFQTLSVQWARDSLV